MSERVITTTVEVTKVYRDVPECFENDKTKYADSMKNRVKDATDADNVVVLDVHEVELQGLRDQMDDEFKDNVDRLEEYYEKIYNENEDSEV